MFMAGRFILGFGSALMSQPQYMAEVAPAHLRGRLVGLFGACFQIGSLVMSAGMIGFTKIDSSDWSWRVPLLLEAFFPTIVCLTIYLLTPETPRYLVMKGKIAKARHVIARYQTDSGDENQPLVDAVISQINHSLEEDKMLNRQWWNFGVFLTKKGRYRLLILVVYSIFRTYCSFKLFVFLYGKDGSSDAVLRLVTTSLSLMITKSQALSPFKHSAKQEC